MAGDGRVLYFVTSNFQISYLKKVHYAHFKSRKALLIGRHTLDFAAFAEADVVSFTSLSAIFSARQILRKLTSLDTVFVPHAHTYLCSFFLRRVNCSKVNVHYEGFSSLVDERLGLIEVIKFSLVSFFLFSGPALNGRYIMPEKSKFNKIYTPIETPLYPDYRQVLVPFVSESSFEVNGAVLVVGEVFADLKDSVLFRMYKSVFSKYKGRLVYFKPHPRDERSYKNAFNGVVVVSKSNPVEESIPSLQVSELVGFVSSSLLNARMRFPEVGVKFFSTDELYKDEFFRKKANYLRQQGFEEIFIEP
ncbi:polysialyltransferase family glycosyltransferase [uncultured Spongiibacter sp.]|uniref:polysialyltransferase family glycosyltransferase n=1 Tax=uncultured Spongiibacter sp. TaxID=870896 RepID=UPI00259246C2|nr:polysialyltransferase family glycosyltransferase [uncultured Spongiibacter sp.]